MSEADTSCMATTDDYPVTIPVTRKVGETIDINLGWREGGVLLDLSTWHALLQVRVNAPSEIVLCELTDSAGEIVLGDGTGTFNIEAHFTEEQTKAIGAGTFKYDIRMSDATESVVIYPVEGPLKLNLPISRTP